MEQDLRKKVITLYLKGELQNQYIRILTDQKAGSLNG